MSVYYMLKHQWSSDAYLVLGQATLGHTLLEGQPLAFMVSFTRTTKPLLLSYVDRLARDMWIVAPLMIRIVAAVTKDNHVARRTMPSLTFDTQSKFKSTPIWSTSLSPTNR